MKIQTKFQNLYETIFAIDREVKTICNGYEIYLKNLKQYKVTFKKILIELNDYKSDTAQGKVAYCDFENIRINLERDVSNTVYEAIEKLGDDFLIVNKQNIIFLFWFLGQFDIYALDLT